MNSQERDFKGVLIPKAIWLDERLSGIEKIIFAEIDSLDNDDGCYASNEYLAKFCQCSESKVSKAIAKLTKFGYVYRESFDGRTRVLRTTLTHPRLSDWQNMLGRLAQDDMQTGTRCQAESQNMTSHILDSSLIDKNNSRGVSKTADRLDDGLERAIDSVITHLNESVGKKYRLTAESHRKLIRARLKDGYQIEDFVSVIDVKCREWEGTEFAKFLRPQTLFSKEHFDTYLNQAEIQVVRGGNRDASDDKWSEDHGW